MAQNSTKKGTSSKKSTKSEKTASKPSQQGASKKSTERENVRIWMGWDTEYNTELSSGVQSPVTTQIYIHGTKKLSRDELDRLVRCCKRRGIKLLDVKSFQSRLGHGLVFVFDDRGLAAGVEYNDQFDTYLRFLLDEVVKAKSSIDYSLELYTFYSNAEIANLAPHKEDIKRIMEEQKDSVKRSNRNLKILTIQGTYVWLNYRRGMPENVVVNIRDVRTLFYKPSLDSLGELVEMPKLEHPNWDEISAGKWLEIAKESFIAYGATDPAIACLSALTFHEMRDKLINDLSNLGVINPLSRTVQKTLESVTMTAASVSDRMVASHFECQGWWDRYEEWTEDLFENYLPPGAQVTKGGLNKYFLSSEPGLYEGVDIFDVASQYSNAMLNLKIPLGAPEHLNFNPAKWSSAKDVAARLIDNDQAYLHVDYELPEGCSERERPFVAKYNGEGCTLRSATKQWMTLWELQLIAFIHPEALIRVRSCMIWKLKIEGFDYITLKEYIQAIIDLRNKYKKQYKESGETDIVAKLMSETIKLIGNGTAGKFGQCKVGLNPDNVHETLMKGGNISNTANGEIFSAKIGNRYVFNLITAMARTYTAYAAWLNGAKMVVTDSMIIDSGAFKDPKDHLTPYWQLNDVLKTFTFEQDNDNVSTLILKERDYAVVDCLTQGAQEKLRKSVEEKELLLEPWEIKVPKVAKRGCSLPRNSDKEIEAFKQRVLSVCPNYVPKGNNWGAYLSNWKFLEKSVPRIDGSPMEFEKSHLLKAKEHLMGEGVLNSKTVKKARIGSYNLRYMCDDEREFHRRLLVKEQCRQKGFADEMDCKLNDSDQWEEIVKRCKPKPHHIKSVPLDIKKLIGILAGSGSRLFSVRRLERITGIGKSTIQRWAKEMKESLLDLSGVGDLDSVLSQVQQWFQQYCPTFPLGDAPK